MEHAKEKEHVHTARDNISKFRLIPCPLCHQTTRWKHRRMTHLIQVQGKTKQALDILH